MKEGKRQTEDRKQETTDREHKRRKKADGKR